MTTYSGSFYFFGNYRPVHFQASTITKLRNQMLDALHNMCDADRDWYVPRIEGIARQMRKDYTSMSADYGTRGVTMRKRAHDGFLDEVTRTLPHYPGLIYV